MQVQKWGMQSRHGATVSFDCARESACHVLKTVCKKTHVITRNHRFLGKVRSLEIVVSPLGRHKF